MSRPKNLPLEQVRVDGDTQVRLAIDQATVDAYADLMDGAEESLPAIKVYFDGDTYWLADGFHRLHAARKLNRKTIRAIVVEGSQRDAQWEALGSNKHGKPLTSAEKANAVKRALQLNGHKSNRDIAAHVGISDKTVAKYRAELESTAEIPQLDTRIGQDGKVRPATVSAPADEDEIPFDLPAAASAAASSPAGSVRMVGASLRRNWPQWLSSFCRSSWPANPTRCANTPAWRRSGSQC